MGEQVRRVADRERRRARGPERGAHARAAAIQQKRESLELSRRRIVREIETARSEVRRASLQQALAFLDKEIEALG